MASILGQLLIELGINTAAFKDGMDKSTYQAKTFAAQLKKEFQEVGNTLQGLAGEFASLAPSISGPLEVVTSAFRSIGTVWEGVEGGVVGGMGGLLAASVGVGAAALGVGAAWAALGLEGGELAERLELISLKTGLSVETLQVYEAAGKTVKVSLEDMVAAMRKFDQALANNGKGAAAAQAVLKGLGVTAHDPKEALEQVAEAFKNLDDPVVRSADAVALFGKSGLNMIPFLVKGKEGLKEFSDLVQEYGPHITGDVLVAQERWEKSTVALGLSWDSLKVSASGVLNILAGLLEKTAVATKFWGEQIGDAVDHFKDLYSVVTSGKLDAGVSAKLSGTDAASAAAQQKILDAKKQAADELMAKQKAAFELEKAGSEAQYALDQKREEIAALLTANKFDLAKAAQAEIPALQAAVDAEKLRLKTIADFPANVTKARDAIVNAFKDIGGEGITDPIDKIEQKSIEAIQKLQQLDQTLGDKVFGKAFQGGLAGAIHQIDQLTDKLKDEAFQKEMDKIVEVVAKLDKANLASNLSFLSQGLPTKDNTGAVLNTAGLYAGAVQSVDEYNNALQKLDNQLRKEKITQDQYNQAVHELNNAMGGAAGGAKLFFEEFKNQNTSAAILTFDLLDKGIHGFEDNLAQAIATGKANWADYFASLEEMILKSSINNLLKSALGFLNNNNFLGSNFGSIFGKGGILGGTLPGKATGGNVMPGQDYVVGEKGPEIFRPGVGGTIIPNGASDMGRSGGGVSVIQNISTPDADSFRRSKNQIAAEAYRDAAVANGRMRS